MTKVIDRALVFGERAGAVERIAPGYFNGAFEAEHVARYTWAARSVSGYTVVDVACGTGYGAGLLREAGAKEVVSIDLSVEALRFGRLKFGLNAVTADAHRLPIRSQGCDVVVSLETVEHLGNPTLFLTEIRRILRPNGTLLLSSPNALRSSHSNPYHVSEMSIDELRRLLEQSGFRIERSLGQHWSPPPGIWNRIVGLRRAVWMIGRTPRLFRWSIPGFLPQYWCVRAVKEGEGRVADD